MVTHLFNIKHHKSTKYQIIYDVSLVGDFKCGNLYVVKLMLLKCLFIL